MSITLHYKICIEIYGNIYIYTYKHTVYTHIYILYI